MKLSIVSYLDEDTTKTVRAIQEELSTITGSKAAVRAWQPHITVGDGPEVDDTQLQQLRKQLASMASNQLPFQLNTIGFGTFSERPIGRSETSTPYVIYLDVALSAPLTHLVESLYKLTDQYDKWYKMVKPYTPHITLAFRDLDEAGFKKGLAYIQNKSGEFSSRIDHLALVEHRADKDEEFERFTFEA